MERERCCEYCKYAYSINEDMQLVCSIKDCWVCEDEICNKYRHF
jgi:hypothetical protein